MMRFKIGCVSEEKKRKIEEKERRRELLKMYEKTESFQNQDASP